MNPGKNTLPFSIELDKDWFDGYLTGKYLFRKPVNKEVFKGPKPFWNPFKSNWEVRFTCKFPKTAYYVLGEGQYGHIKTNNGYDVLLKREANGSYKIKGIPVSIVEGLIPPKYSRGFTLVGYDSIIATPTVALIVVKHAIMNSDMTTEIVDYFFNYQDLWNIGGGVKEYYSGVYWGWRYNPRTGQYDINMLRSERGGLNKESVPLYSVEEDEDFYVHIKAVDGVYSFTVGDPYEVIQPIMTQRRRFTSKIPYSKLIDPVFSINDYYKDFLSFYQKIQVISWQKSK